MATLALSLAGQAVGGLVGGPLGATVGRALGALAGNAIDNALFAPEPATAGRDIRLQGSSQGGALPRIYGWNRLAGNIIWATGLERLDEEATGAKSIGGDPSGEQDAIVANFAVAFCEGDVSHLGRIWADGQLLDTEGLTIRFYSGSADQDVDSLVLAKQGPDGAPAYRGTCYLVFERLPLAGFGNRIPNITAELCRVCGDLEGDIRAVTVIPGATEFGYDPTPRLRLVSPGVSEPENAHVFASTSDWTLSIDELQGLCPNLEHVALVVSWFGTDLRCGECEVAPRVEAASRQIEGTEWKVNGVTREAAQLVSSHDGGPAYGGTPSDAAVLAAIADLKARGLKVTLYPFLLMDIAAGNALDDPHSLTAGQPAYPWRGRLTCHPAPGSVGSVDRTAAAASQIESFVGTAAASDFSTAGGSIAYSGAAEWSYRRFVLHYAHLCALAGGVDTFLIGSEMRGLTSVRDSDTTFPFVDALVELAADVKDILGAETRVSYAADWSEYHGYQPADAPGDKLFHLDPLWSSEAVDAVAIDNYMPIADWRDGSAHADAALAASTHDLDYLGANIASGEGYDWYYASPADREAGERTPILDGAHAEPWVWRFKDLVGWWSHAHHNRVAGVRSATPTGWVAGAKPIWFTELGCGAVDKGANTPSAFADPKSSEDDLPHFSSGSPDALIQRQLLRAHLRHWSADSPSFAEANNPSATLYAGRMVDVERIYMWTWDARPYPAFPIHSDLWADGPNHATGHWLAGRLGAAAADELIARMAADFEVDVTAVAAAGPLIHGTAVQGISGLRAGLETLLGALDLSVRDEPDGLSFIRRAPGPVLLNEAQLAETGGPALTLRRGSLAEAAGDLGLAYAERARDYQQASLTAVAVDGTAHVGIATDLVLDSGSARRAAEQLLANARQDGSRCEFALPPSWARLEVGDVLRIEGRREPPLLVTEIRDGLYRSVTAMPVAAPLVRAIAPVHLTVPAAEPATTRAVPAVMLAHLPPDDQGGPTRIAAGAFARPWPGSVVLTEAATGAEMTRLARPARMGVLTAPLAAGDACLWDLGALVELELYGGHLSSLPDMEVLNGGNRLLVERGDGFELLGFAAAELIAPNRYRLSRLLRGLGGTAPGVAVAGAGVMALDGAVSLLPLPDERLGTTLAVEALAGPGAAEGTGHFATTHPAAAAPLAPAHARTERLPSGDVVLTWVRRSRLNGNSWAYADVPLDVMPEAYRVTVLDASTPVRSIDVDVSSFLYPATDQIADFGSLPSLFTFSIAQLSPVHGPGAAATGEFHD